MKTEYKYLLVWLLVNLITAFFTELYSDEAYYWMYSEFLDWGYFDHPPMVALMIKSTSFLGQNELAVRLPFIILLTLALWITYKLANVDAHLFFLSAFSIFSLNINGFLALPDTPYLFFGVLFLYQYKKYLIDKSILNAILISIIGACLLYSKYHGVLIISFTLLSNLKLLKDWKTYFIGILILLLFTPHLLWQYENDFPSYLYHMVERSAQQYKLTFTTTYLATNLLFHGPLVGVLLLIFTVSKSKDLLEKALKLILFGTLIFFLFSSLKAHVQANWTMFIIFPLLILGIRSLENHPKWINYHKKMAFGLIALLIVFRIHLIHPLVDVEKDRVKEFHGNKEFVNNVIENANGKPIVANRYQEASILSFYHPEKHYHVPALNVRSRSNQFNIWKLDSLLEGKEAYYLNNHIQNSIEIEALERNVKKLSMIKELPRVTGFSLKTAVISKTKNQLTFSVDINGPNEILKDDKTLLSIHVISPGGNRYPNHKLKNGNIVKTTILPKDKEIRVYLVSNRLKGSIQAYDKIDLTNLD